MFNIYVVILFALIGTNSFSQTDPSLRGAIEYASLWRQTEMAPLVTHIAKHIFQDRTPEFTLSPSIEDTDPVASMPVEIRASIPNLHAASWIKAPQENFEMMERQLSQNILEVSESVEDLKQLKTRSSDYSQARLNEEIQIPLQRLEYALAKTLLPLVGLNYWMAFMPGPMQGRGASLAPVGAALMTGVSFTGLMLSALYGGGAQLLFPTFVFSLVAVILAMPPRQASSIQVPRFHSALQSLSETLEVPYLCSKVFESHHSE